MPGTSAKKRDKISLDSLSKEEVRVKIVSEIAHELVAGLLKVLLRPLTAPAPMENAARVVRAVRRQIRTPGYPPVWVPTSLGACPMGSGT